MLLSQPEFSFSARGPFTKNKERMQKFKETGDSRYIYQNELDNTCFRHDMDYEDFKDLPLKLLILLKIRNMIHILLRWFINFLTKNLLAQSSGGAVKSEIMPKQKLTEELRKPIIQGGDLADTRLINLSLIYYVLLIFIANMHGSVTKVFQEIIHEP